MNRRTDTTHPEQAPINWPLPDSNGARPANDLTAGEARDGEGYFAGRAREGRTGAVDDLITTPPSGEVPESTAPAPVLLPTVTAGVAPMNAQWPLSNRLSLAALPVATPTARAEVKVLLIEWNLVRLSEPAELCTAELMGNAVKAVNDLHPDLRQPIVLRVSSDHKRLLLEIWDCNPEPPPMQVLEAGTLPSLELEGGRGLFLVGHYSEQWNYYWTAQWGGKVVWAILGETN